MIIMAPCYLCWIFLLFAGSSEGIMIRNIHWNASNPLFTERRGDVILEVNGGNHPWEYDQVNVICPTYGPENHRPEETYIIYSVSRREYETCRITSPNPKIVALCNSPREFMYFTITFRSFTPTPGGLEFQPGKDYYFVSTSSEGDIHRKIGGSCASHHMKIMFKVADVREELETNTVDRELRHSELRADNSEEKTELSNEEIRKEQRVSSAASAKRGKIRIPLIILSSLLLKLL